MDDARHRLAPGQECGCGGHATTTVSRRRFVGATAGVLAAAPLHAVAQSTPETDQPVATPAATVAIDLEQLRGVSLALVGGGSFSDAGLQTLGGLISNDPARVSAFEEMATLDDPSTPEALDGMPAEARALVDDIMSFWYLGNYAGAPVANRAELFFGLPVWATVPYTTQPTLCKAFGYWATEVSLDD